MGDDELRVTVDLDWSEPPALRVEATAEGLRVTAHPGLSEGQVREACRHIDGHGDLVFRAWQGAVGRE